jgi:hypothetical protein
MPPNDNALFGHPFAQTCGRRIVIVNIPESSAVAQIEPPSCSVTALQRGNPSPQRDSSSVSRCDGSARQNRSNTRSTSSEGRLLPVLLTVTIVALSWAAVATESCPWSLTYVTALSKTFWMTSRSFPRSVISVSRSSNFHSTISPRAFAFSSSGFQHSRMTSARSAHS